MARGSLISHEHPTTGTVRLLRAADGSHLVRLENLDTSSGPDLWCDRFNVSFGAATLTGR